LNLTKDEIKKRYKELRRNEKYKHSKGGGIGLYEIAKTADNFEFSFEEKQNGYLFIFKAEIVQKSQKGI